MLNGSRDVDRRAVEAAQNAPHSQFRCDTIGIQAFTKKQVHTGLDKIEIIPLGGIGEFGMNCMGIRFRDEMIIVDAGMGFPGETPYGVDISIPNFDFLEEYRDDLTAIILTHGHEDHIGALSYILRKFNLPVYGSRFTLALAEKRLEEFRMLDDVLLHRVEASQTVEIGSFRIEFIHASHSLV
jgi:ribonuclease J